MFNFFNPFGDLFMLMFFVIFFLAICTIMFSLISSISEHNKNRKQPIVPTQAKVISKFQDVTNHLTHSQHNNTMSHTNTNYYIAFEFSNHERVQFKVSKLEFGKIIEGDVGILTFQGSRFISFERNI